MSEEIPIEIISGTTLAATAEIQQLSRMCFALRKRVDELSVEAHAEKASAEANRRLFDWMEQHKARIWTTSDGRWRVRVVGDDGEFINVAGNDLYTTILEAEECANTIVDDLDDWD